jgi:hypothetical protein
MDPWPRAMMRKPESDHGYLQVAQAHFTATVTDMDTRINMLKIFPLIPTVEFVAQIRTT